MVSLKETSEKIAIRAFACPHCSSILGNQTDNFLYIGMAKHTKLITFQCMACDKYVRWCPKDENLGKSK